jgi:hypothetical protein
MFQLVSFQCLILIQNRLNKKNKYYSNFKIELSIFEPLLLSMRYFKTYLSKFIR